MKQSQRGSQFGWLPKFQRTSQDVFCPPPTSFAYFWKQPMAGEASRRMVTRAGSLGGEHAAGLRGVRGRRETSCLSSSPLLLPLLCFLCLSSPTLSSSLPAASDLEGHSCQAPHTWAPWLSQQPQDQRQSCAIWEGERQQPPCPLLLIYDWHTTLYMFKVYNRKIWYLYLLWYCVTIRWYSSPHIGSPSNHSSHLWGEPVRCIF